ncbi:MAG: lamin tail domain-containing protein, partial [Verrucomicrobiota bacterium]
NDTPLPVGSAASIEFYIEIFYNGASSGTVFWPDAGASTPIQFNRSTYARRQNTPSRRRSGFIVSEIMYNPSDQISGLDLEFVEIYNADTIDFDISGFRISGDVDYTFPDGTTFPAGGRFVIADNPDDVRSAYNLPNVFGPWDGNLPNDVGTVRLRNNLGAVLTETVYRDKSPWPASADGGGHSLVLTRPDYGDDSHKAWSQSRWIGGSPGSADPKFDDPSTNVVINELLVHTDDPEFDFIELYNRGTTPVEIGGWVLMDNPSSNKFVIPGPTTLNAGDFISFHTNNSVLPFELSSRGERLYLINSNETAIIDSHRFPAQQNGLTLGRYPDGAPGFQHLQTPTLEAPNADYFIHDIVINEIMFNSLTADINAEYIEIHNRGGSSVDLSYWRFSGGVGFTFPSNTSIAAGSFLVVAKNATNLIANYPQLNAANTLGNYNGTLANRGEKVILSKPDDPLLPFQDFVTVDEVTYGDGPRWGQWADGGGSSLELIDPASDNRLAQNWMGSDETAKAGWTWLSHTGRLDNGNGAADEIHIYLMDEGDCLVDDVELFEVGLGNQVPNPGFESGLTSWLIHGNHIETALETSQAHSGVNSLRVVSSG